MGRKLVIPFQLAGIRIERDHGTAIEIVAPALVAVPVRTGISDAPISQVEIRIVGTRHPHGSAPSLPRIASPGFVARLARARDGVKSPNFFARFHIVGRQETADTVLTAGGTDNHLVLHDQRGHGQSVAGLGFRYRNVPQRTPVFGVNRDQTGVDRRHEQRVAQDRHSPVHAAAARAGRLFGSVGIRPEDASGGGVQSDDVIRRLHGVHDSVYNQRRSFELFKRSSLKDPLQLEVFHILRSDLAKRAIPLPVVVSGVREPVVRLLIGAQDALKGNLRLQRTGGNDNEE